MLTTDPRPHVASTVLALAALACGSAPTSQDGETSDGTSSTTTEGTTVTSDAESSDVGSAATTDGDTSSESGIDPQPSCSDPTGAEAVLRDVSLFQTIGVPIARDCTPIDADDRIAPIVAGRVALARATVALGAGAAPTDLVAHLELSSVAGEETFTGPCTHVESGATTADLRVDVPAASIRADTRWSMGVTTCEGTELTAIASGDPAELGAETTGVLRVHLVPFEVGGFVPDTSQSVIDGYRDALLAHYPVTDVEITVGAVQADDNAGQVDMGALLVRIVQLQEQDLFASGDADPTKIDVYWYGLVSGAATREEFCDDCPTGTSEAGGGNRAGSAMGAAFADALSESTLVHEMGHLHGLLHSPCGDPQLQDPAFPYPDGATNVEGWDVRTDEFLPPTHADLMGYCQPRWVSDYHFRKLVDWVQLATSWRDGARAPMPDARLGRAACRDRAREQP